MPVRSLNTSVLSWPGKPEVHAAVKQWAYKEAAKRPELVSLGYMGSYARGDWGVGSDVDLVIIVTSSDKPKDRRPVDWPTEELPVPADTFVFTISEWESLQKRRDRFAREAREETVWVYSRNAGD